MPGRPPGALYTLRDLDTSRKPAERELAQQCRTIMGGAADDDDPDTVLSAWARLHIRHIQLAFGIMTSRHSYLSRFDWGVDGVDHGTTVAVWKCLTERPIGEASPRVNFVWNVSPGPNLRNICTVAGSQYWLQFDP